MTGPRWKRKVGKMGNKYPYLTLPVEFSDWIGKVVEIQYENGALIITLARDKDEEK